MAHRPPGADKFSGVIASLSEQYRRQDRWRRWDEALRLLPVRRGERVVDLGCGIGDVTARLSALGADVLGIDTNEALLSEARACHPHVSFENLNLNDVSQDRLGSVDGVWASFVTAYFPDLSPVLSRWVSCLCPGGWVALVEVDDLLGHEPLPAEFRNAVTHFYAAARQSGRYDFEGGRKLGPALSAAGLELVQQTMLPDDELSFCGPASPEVIEAWRARLDRMEGLKAFLHDRFDAFEAAFLAALVSNQHQCTTRVTYVIARRKH